MATMARTWLAVAGSKGRPRAPLVARNAELPDTVSGRGPDDASEFLFQLIGSLMTAPNGGRTHPPNTGHRPTRARPALHRHDQWALRQRVAERSAVGLGHMWHGWPARHPWGTTGARRRR